MCCPTFPPYPPALQPPCPFNRIYLHGHAGGQPRPNITFLRGPDFNRLYLQTPPGRVCVATIGGALRAGGTFYFCSCGTTMPNQFAWEQELIQTASTLRRRVCACPTPEMADVITGCRCLPMTAQEIALQPGKYSFPNPNGKFVCTKLMA
jgi:hypothetical protein